MIQSVWQARLEANGFHACTLVALLFSAGIVNFGMGSLLRLAEFDRAFPVRSLDTFAHALEFVFHRTFPAQVCRNA